MEAEWKNLICPLPWWLVYSRSGGTQDFIPVLTALVNCNKSNNSKARSRYGWTQLAWACTEMQPSPLLSTPCSPAPRQIAFLRALKMGFSQNARPRFFFNLHVFNYGILFFLCFLFCSPPSTLLFLSLFLHFLLVA